MQPAEKNEDSATQSGRRENNDDEVISATSSNRAEHPDDCRGTVPTTKKIQKIVDVRHREVGIPSHRRGQGEVLP